MRNSSTTPVQALLDWLIAMDDPASDEGVEARRTVTLTRIIERARDTRRWIEVAAATGVPVGYPTDGSAPRLWEVEHPYYGYSEGYSEKVASFARLREQVDGMDEDMNFVYRWDWQDYAQPHYDDLYLSPAEREEQTFTIYWLMPRKGQFGSLSCPITHEQEAEVLDWLRSDRMLGYIRTMWAPLLDARP
jgi:hypothetical protein